MTLCMSFVSCGIPEEERLSAPEVRFTGYTSAPMTKTQYSGVKDGLQYILWEKDKDILTIVSPDAQVYVNPDIQTSFQHNRPISSPWFSTADYKISSRETQGTTDVGEIVALPKAEGGTGSGLLWHKSSDPQTGDYRFYGMYPSSKAFKSGDGSNVNPDNVWITLTSSSDNYATASAFLPKAQTPKAQYDPAASDIKIEPDMRYAYMYAASKVNITTAGEWPQKDVAPMPMDFYPMVTTFQFTVGKISDAVQGYDVKNDEITLHEFTLSSKSCALCGRYEAQISLLTSPDPNWNKNPAANESSRSKVSYLSGSWPQHGDQTSEITLKLPNNGVTFNSNQHVEITLFVLPKGIAYKSGTPALADYPGGSTITDLTVTFKTTHKNKKPEGAGVTSEVRVTRSLDLRPSDPNNITSNVSLSDKGFVEFPAGKKINISGITLPVQLDPWRFSVATADYEEELSDVVIVPVTLEEWVEEVAPNRLDDSGDYHIEFVQSSPLEVKVNGSSKLEVRVTKDGNTVTPSRIHWDATGLDGTKAVLQPGLNNYAWIHGIAAAENAGTVKASVTIAGKTFTKTSGGQDCAIAIRVTN